LRLAYLVAVQHNRVAMQYQARTPKRQPIRPAMPRPTCLDKEIILGDGRCLRIRPIVPGDAAALVEMGRRSTPEDLRLRFFGPVRPALGPLASRLTDFDPHRHIACAAYDPASPGPDQEFLGVVRLIVAPDDRHAECAILVRSDFQGRGLGEALIREMLGWASELDLASVTADILHENKAMLRLARRFGGLAVPRTDDFQVLSIVFQPPWNAQPPAGVDGRGADTGTTDSVLSAPQGAAQREGGPP
jgi:acetyltransferase